MTPKSQTTIEKKKGGTHQTKKLSSKRQKMTNVGEDVKKVNPCALLVERQIDTAHCQNTMEFPLKVKNKMAI